MSKSRKRIKLSESHPISISDVSIKLSESHPISISDVSIKLSESNPISISDVSIKLSESHPISISNVSILNLRINALSLHFSYPGVDLCKHKNAKVAFVSLLAFYLVAFYECGVF